jgi:nucleoside-diphosphate-sugar epimerase
MRCLVAGCGYVGSALAARLAARGCEVFGLRRRPAGLPAGVVPVAADLSDRAGLAARLPRGLDSAIYAAAADARDEAAYRRAYVEGLANLLAALDPGSRAARVLFTSSTAVYGQDDGSFVDESSPAEPAGWNGRVMLEAEARLAASGHPFSILRLGGIYGPGRTRLIERVRAGAEPLPPGPAWTNRIHRDDAAGALDHLLGLASPEAVYLGVDDEPADQREVLRWLAARLGVPAPAASPEDAGPSAATGKRCRNGRLRASGWVPRYPSYRDGYAAILEEGRSARV